MKFATFLIVLMTLLGFGTLVVFYVPEGSEALVLRAGEAQRKLGPGFGAHVPIVEQVRIESLRQEHLYDFAEPFSVGGCDAKVQAVWRIGDLEAWITGHKNLTALNGLGPKIATVLASGENAGDAAALQGLAGPLEGGAVVTHYLVTPELGCTPEVEQHG